MLDSWPQISAFKIVCIHSLGKGKTTQNHKNQKPALAMQLVKILCIHSLGKGKTTQNYKNPKTSTSQLATNF